MPRIPIIYRAADEAGNAIGGSSQEVRIWDNFACTVASVVTDDSGGGTTITQPLIPNAGTYTTLAVTTAAVDTTITVTSTTGFAVGQMITIFDATNTVYKWIRAILSGPPRLTLESAVGFIFTTASAQVGNLDQVGVVGGWVLDTSYHYSQVTDVASGRKGPPQLISAVIGSANVGILEEGAGGGTRPTVNFIGDPVTAVDNAGASRVDVTVLGRFAAGSLAAPGVHTTSDTNTGLWWNGADQFVLVGGGKEIIHVIGNTTNVNYMELWGAATGTAPSLRAQGSDTDVELSLSSKGAGAVRIYSGSRVRTLGLFADVASAVNYHQFTPSATGFAPTIGPGGADTNIEYVISSKGSAGIKLYAGGVRLMGHFADVASAVNHLQFSPGATANSVKVEAAGSDVNVDLSLIPKGTGVLKYKSGAQIWPLFDASSVLTAGDVTMTTAGTWYDGPSISLASGTWMVWAMLTIQSGNVAGGRVVSRITDGTTHYGSTEIEAPGLANEPVSLVCIARITLGSTTTIKAQATASQNAGAILMSTPTSGSGNNASQIIAFRVLTS